MDQLDPVVRISGIAITRSVDQLDPVVEFVELMTCLKNVWIAGGR